MDDRAIERLKWRSRRGLLELDLILGRFWQAHGGTLEAGEARALDRLLLLPDNDILDLVMARRAAEDPAIEPIVRQLRES